MRASPTICVDRPPRMGTSQHAEALALHERRDHRALLGADSFYAAAIRPPSLEPVRSGKVEISPTRGTDSVVNGCGRGVGST